MLSGRVPSSPSAAEKALRIRLKQATAERPPTASACPSKAGIKIAPVSFNSLLLAIQNAQEECQRGLEDKRSEEGTAFHSMSFLSGSDIRAALKHGATVIQKTSTGYSMFPWTSACNSAQQLRQVSDAPILPTSPRPVLTRTHRFRSASWSSSPSSTAASSSTCPPKHPSAGAPPPRSRHARDPAPVAARIAVQDTSLYHQFT